MANLLELSMITNGLLPHVCNRLVTTAQSMRSFNLNLRGRYSYSHVIDEKTKRLTERDQMRMEAKLACSVNTKEQSNRLCNMQDDGAAGSREKPIQLRSGCLPGQVLKANGRQMCYFNCLYPHFSE